MSFADDVLRLLRSRDDGAWVFDDSAVDRLVALVGALPDDGVVAGADALLDAAHFLHAEKGASEAAGTLVTLALELVPRLRALDRARADTVLQRAEAAGAKLASFTGDARVTKVLDSGARPVGTTPAGPLARFTVQKK